MIYSKNILDKWYEQYTKVNETNLFDKDILKPLLDDLNTPAYISNLHVLYEKAKKGSSATLLLCLIILIGGCGCQPK